MFLQKKFNRTGKASARLNPFQGLVGVSTKCSGKIGGEQKSLNPFQGLVGVSTGDADWENMAVVKVSIPFRVWSVFLLLRAVIDRLNAWASQSLSGFGRCFYKGKARV